MADHVVSLESYRASSSRAEHDDALPRTGAEYRAKLDALLEALTTQPSHSETDRIRVEANLGALRMARRLADNLP